MDQDHFDEEWTLILNNSRYSLNKKEAEVLNDAIAQGRGIVQFKECVVNIPFIQEFFLEKKFLKPEYELAETEKVEEEITPEQRAINLEKIREMKKKVMAKSKIPPALSPQEFEKRRAFLLKQAERLEK